MIICAPSGSPELLNESYFFTTFPFPLFMGRTHTTWCYWSAKATIEEFLSEAVVKAAFLS
jgi:hypothetical protein